MEEIDSIVVSKEVAPMESRPMEVDLEGTFGDSPQSSSGSKKKQNSLGVELSLPQGIYF